MTDRTTAAPDPHTLIDPRVPRFNQGVTGVLLAAAFLADLPLLVPFAGIVLALGAVFGTRFNLWAQVFLRIVKPAFRLGPPTHRKAAAPTRFAMTLGAVFLTVSTVLLYGIPTALGAWLGWGAALAVAALALLAAVTDLCVGCEIYAYAARSKRREEPGPADT